MSLIAAFSAGLLSFLSPCVLPLIPGYLSFMTGLTTTELADSDRSVSRVMVPAVLFVVGFTIVFVAMGASASVIGQFLGSYRVVVERIAGIVVILFGVFMLGIIKVPWLYGEARADMARTRKFGHGASVAMGMAFAAGWTPCVGPILGTILALAGSTGSVAQGALLLLIYSLGLGIPFLAVALLFGRTKPLMAWLNRHALTVNRVAGVTLVAIGLLIFTGRLSALASWMATILHSL